MPHRSAFLLALLLGACMTSAPATPIAPTLTPTQFVLLDRVTSGANATDVAILVRLGSARWLDRQLHPPATDALPAEVSAQIARLPMPTNMATAVIRLQTPFERSLHLPIGPERDRIADVYSSELTRLGEATAERALLRALYDPAQLKEQLSWF